VSLNRKYKGPNITKLRGISSITTMFETLRMQVFGTLGSNYSRLAVINYAMKAELSNRVSKDCVWFIIPSKLTLLT